MNSKKYIIFTDLDGTLLDHHTYSFAEALPALNYIKQNNIFLILSSSKTREEMIGIQKKIGIAGHPFVVENGSAFYTDNNYFPEIPGGENFESYTQFCLGKTFNEIKEALTKISDEYNYKIIGFHNTDKTEIIKRTNLSSESVEYAIHREFSIPLFYDDKAEQILLKEIKKYNLQILYGGRFMHLLGKTDKGKAMEIIANNFNKKIKDVEIQTIAIGDTLNDVSMLQKADHKILVKKHDGNYDPRIQIENLIYSPYIGPKGWNYSILKILGSGE